MLHHLILPVLFLSAFAKAGPLFERSHIQQQEVLKTDGLIMPSKQQKKVHSSSFLDAVPNSIGVLIATPGGEEEELLHLWLPIGHHPILPLHPRQVRITTAIAAEPEQASTEYLAGIECRIFPGFSGPMQLVDRTKALPTEFAARSFWKADGSVLVGGLFGFDGWEVEGYECSETS